MKKKLNKEKLFSFILIIFGILLISIISIKVYFDFFKNNVNETTELKRLEIYGYTLESRDNSMYKTYYNDLSNVLNKKEIDYEKYAELISKLYIIDFYTLSNKIASTDIGGCEFVHPDEVENFKVKAEDTVYKYLKNNFDGKREQALPEVSQVTVESVEKNEYTYNDEIYNSYLVKINWEYTEDMKYEKTSILTLIKDGNKLYVVESD